MHRNNFYGRNTLYPEHINYIRIIAFTKDMIREMSVLPLTYYMQGLLMQAIT